MERIEKLKAMMLENPADAFLAHALALEHIKIGDDVMAEQLFKDLLAREPDYVGSYYHLGKILERRNQEQEAIAVYKSGMEMALKAGEQHAYGELRSACEYLEF